MSRNGAIAIGCMWLGAGVGSFAAPYAAIVMFICALAGTLVVSVND